MICPVSRSHTLPRRCERVSLNSHRTDMKLKYHHLGVPTDEPREGERYLPEYKLFVCGFGKNAYGIEWMRFDRDCPLPELIRTRPHIAFEVEDVSEAIEGKRVLIEPNSPSKGVVVAFIEEEGLPIEFIQIAPAG